MTACRFELGLAVSAMIERVLFVGAARREADPAQLERLRGEVVPMLPRYRIGEVTWDDVRAKVQEIMGASWEPGS